MGETCKLWPGSLESEGETSDSLGRRRHTALSSLSPAVPEASISEPVFRVPCFIPSQACIASQLVTQASSAALSALLNEEAREAIFPSSATLWPGLPPSPTPVPSLLLPLVSNFCTDRSLNYSFQRQKKKEEKEGLGRRIGKQRRERVRRGRRGRQQRWLPGDKVVETRI